METCNCIYCQLILCAKCQNPRITPSVKKVCDTENWSPDSPILLTLCLLYLCKVSPIIFVVKQVSKGGDQQKDLTNGLVWHPVDWPVAA